jgi:hypothetical protein
VSKIEVFLGGAVPVTNDVRSNTINVTINNPMNETKEIDTKSNGASVSNGVELKRMSAVDIYKKPDDRVISRKYSGRTSDLSLALKQISSKDIMSYDKHNTLG